MNLALRCIRLAPKWLVPGDYIVQRGDRRCGRIALTFDDGPNPTCTPQILDLLDAHRVRATFFLIGRAAESHPELTRDIVRRGHDVGNHTYSHANLTRVPPRILRQEIDKGRAVLEDVTGSPIRLFRPPWGYLSLRLLAHARRTGTRVVLWSVDSRDWMRNGEESIREVISQTHMRPGDIVLFHDDYPETVAALPGILRQPVRSALSFGTLAEVLGES
jgi:peptidoglycan/xylan/chitin deacetylase (PgdA/CDA1 family)